MHKKLYNFLLIACLTPLYLSAQEFASKSILNGDEQTAIYLPLLMGKKVALLANQTAIVNEKHLLDVLIENKINVVKIFSPEHGFRGNEDAGSSVKNQIDKKTNLPIISLYGDKKKPSAVDLENVDVLVFDIQDVGVRFFTFISTLSYAMDAAAENDIELIVLDRGNPNANYIDGPVLQQKFKSFVGMHPVPIVYGMTIGEYAKMVNGEKWLSNNGVCKLKVIPVLNYKHSSYVKLPLPPSPNLNTEISIYLYPSLCLFEGSIISLGRGTKKPFTMYGHPNLLDGDYFFKPKAIKHMSSNPPFKNKKCRGFNLQNTPPDSLGKINLNYLIHAYKAYPEKEKFFNNFFNNLAGNDVLKQQVIEGKSDVEIHQAWNEDLNDFQLIRKKYLIYED